MSPRVSKICRGKGRWRPVTWVGWMLRGIPTQHQCRSRCGWGGPSFVLLQHRNIPVIALRPPPASPRYRKPIANASHGGHFGGSWSPPALQHHALRVGCWQERAGCSAAWAPSCRISRAGPGSRECFQHHPKSWEVLGQWQWGGSAGCLALALRTGKATGRRRSDPSASRHPPLPAGF